MVETEIVFLSPNKDSFFQKNSSRFVQLVTQTTDSDDWSDFYWLGVCPSSWYYYDKHCWYFAEDDESVPWKAAQDLCKTGSEFANLISIHDEKDNAFVTDIATGTSEWIGLEIRGENDYHWTDGSSLDYQNWKKGGSYS